MGKFHTFLDVRHTGNVNSCGREECILLAPLVYELGSNGTGQFIIAPKEYMTDFASVPRFFWRIIPPWGRYGRASVIHDFLCECENVSRHIADAVFLEAMKSLGVWWWRRTAMYFAVRTYWICIGQFKRTSYKYAFKCDACQKGKTHECLTCDRSELSKPTSKSQGCN